LAAERGFKGKVFVLGGFLVVFGRVKRVITKLQLKKFAGEICDWRDLI
jgi:hypothetical protein